MERIGNGKESASRWRRIFAALKDDQAQVLPWAAMLMVMFLSMTALVADIGHAYYCYRALQASTDAAALAAAQSLPSTSATSVAATYGASSSGLNQVGGLTGVTMTSGYPVLKCLTTLKNEGMACTAPADANAVQVKQTAKVTTYFSRVFGVGSLSITTSATAAMRGAAPSPYNVVVVVDTTASMNDTDSDSQCSTTRISCALAGVQTLLNSLSPCGASLSTCGSAVGGNVSNSVDRVALFTFPAVTVGTVADDYDCKTTTPTATPYTFPSTTGTTYAPTGSTTGTYEIVNYSSDYRTSDSTTSLSGSSSLVEAVGGKASCSGMAAPGGEGTYYAGVIYAAQAALTAEAAGNPGSQNVMIVISDGDANSKSTQMGSSASASSGVYPSLVDQCGQAVTAAKAATAAGTRVYAVAYGAEATGCTTDTSGFSKGYTPCLTMENMASAAQYFFSDYTSTGSTSSCVSSSQPTTNLNQIFTQIAGDMTVARLIPDSTT